MGPASRSSRLDGHRAQATQQRGRASLPKETTSIQGGGGGRSGSGRASSLHVEYAERGKEYGILFIFSLFCEYIHLEYVRIHVIYRVNQAEHVIRIRVFAPQEYVNIYSTRRASRSSRPDGRLAPATQQRDRASLPK